MEEREQILRTLVLSLTIIVSLSIVTFSILTWGSSISLAKDSMITKLIISILTGFHFLFVIIFIGNLIELLNRKPGVISMLFMFIIEFIYLYLLNINRDFTMFSGSIAAILLAFVYAIVSS